MGKQEKIILGCVLGVLVLTLGILVGSSFGNGDSEPEVQSEPATDVEVQATPATQISVDEIFTKVTNGMTKEQVQDVAGREPDSVDESSYNGTTYENWSYNEGSSFISINFENGVVFGKSKY